MNIIEKYKPGEVVKVEKEGKFGNLTKKEYTEKLKYEELIESSNSARTFEHWLRGRIKVANFAHNYDMARLLEAIRFKYLEYQKHGIIKVYGWKGKSSIEVLKAPDRIIIMKYQRPDKDSEPKLVKTEVSKEELNALISAINACQGKEKIETKDIAFFYYNLLGIKHNRRGEPLYDSNGKLDWNKIFCWRREHNRLTLSLDALAAENVIEYKGGIIKILNPKITIQEILDV